MTNNTKVLQFVEESRQLTNPDKVIWIDGSEAQLNLLRKEAISTGEMIKLNEDKYPGCLYHRTRPNDVARVEGRTFICSRNEKDAGPTNNWKAPSEMYAMLKDIARGSMKGRAM
ncbi:MAG: phosphoenolpyruvate carboxykinase, partial [Clostridia bacterium]